MEGVGCVEEWGHGSPPPPMYRRFRQRLLRYLRPRSQASWQFPTLLRPQALFRRVVIGQFSRGCPVGECVCIRFGRTRNQCGVFVRGRFVLSPKTPNPFISVNNLRIKMSNTTRKVTDPWNYEPGTTHRLVASFFRRRFPEDACKNSESAPRKRVADTATRATRVRGADLLRFEAGRLRESRRRISRRQTRAGAT